MAGTVSNAKRNSFKVELLVVFAILISLGFPGNYALVYGEQVETVMAYAVFIAQILAMLLSSGNSWLDVQIINLDRKYTVMYLFAAVIFVESMWVAEYKDLEFITCTRLTVTIFFVIWLQEQFEFERMIELICTAQTIFLIVTLFFTLQYFRFAFSGGTPFTEPFIGLYGTKNTCASELAFGIIIIGFLIRQRAHERKIYFGWLVIEAIQIALLLMCQASGAPVCTVCVLILFLFVKYIRIPMGWIYIAGNILFLFLTLTLMPAFEWIFELLGKDATLTGRIPLWNQMITVLTRHNTFTGFGYGMFWRDENAVALVRAPFEEGSFLGSITSGAHNMLLEIWANSGLIGIALLFAMVLFSMKKLQIFSEEQYIFCVLILTYLMLNGFTERCLGGNYDYKMMGFLLVIALGCRLSSIQDTDENRKRIEN